MFTATRAAGLDALQRFLDQAGRPYAEGRNYDLDPQAGGAVSRLSPYIRHRLITEEEVIKAVLSQHSPKAAEKFLQEVFWRSYWKGWLQQRPGVWAAYQMELQQGQNRLQTEAGLRLEHDAACRGETEIECFNNWAQQLVTTGYLHNHARMWFASIWIFTLRLPWTLGADFFMRHLIDGDPASNTLSWRWVAGLQTKGKTYLATAENIAKFTKGRFQPSQGQLASYAAPLEGPPHPERIPLPLPQAITKDLKTGLLIHDDDISADHLSHDGPVIYWNPAAYRSPLPISDPVRRFVTAALGGDAVAEIADILRWAKTSGLEQVVTPVAPIGPTDTQLNLLEKHLKNEGIVLARISRPYDLMCWPKATHGFFRFKDHIPQFLQRIRDQ